MNIPFAVRTFKKGQWRYFGPMSEDAAHALAHRIFEGDAKGQTRADTIPAYLAEGKLETYSEGALATKETRAERRARNRAEFRRKNASSRSSGSGRKKKKKRGGFYADKSRVRAMYEGRWGFSEKYPGGLSYVSSGTGYPTREKAEKAAERARKKGAICVVKPMTELKGV